MKPLSSRNLCLLKTENINILESDKTTSLNHLHLALNQLLKIISKEEASSGRAEMKEAVGLAGRH